MRRCVVAILTAALLLVVTVPAFAQYVERHKADPFLARFVGVWTGTPVGPNPGMQQQTTAVRWTLNNRYLYINVTERTLGQQTITYACETFIGYDPELKKYDVYIFDTIGFSHLTGVATDKALVATLTASDGHIERVTFTPESPTEYTRLYETSRDGSTFTTFSSTRYVRREGEAIRPHSGR